MRQISKIIQLNYFVKTLKIVLSITNIKIAGVLQHNIAIFHRNIGYITKLVIFVTHMSEHEEPKFIIKLNNHDLELVDLNLLLTLALNLL